MECKFQAGDRVVCVDASVPARGYWTGDPLAEGAVYTVDEVGVNRCGAVGIRVREVWRQPLAGFHAWRFRPAEDIEQFRRIVANAPRERMPA